MTPTERLNETVAEAGGLLLYDFREQRLRCFRFKSAAPIHPVLLSRVHDNRARLAAHLIHMALGPITETE